MYPDWRIIADSVTGSSHIRKDRPNQDNGGWYAGSGYPLIGAVSDGHGGRDYPRSDRGSALGVHAALRVLSVYSQDPSVIHSAGMEKICREIVDEWRREVRADIRMFPYEPGEREIITEGRQGQNAPLDPDYELIRPYGSTLLAVVITGEETVFFQLGDGDIIVHAPDGSFFLPIAPDNTLSGNETYSLCTDESWRDFRIARLDYVPDFIMLSTDGYANSFLDEEGFVTAARDLYSYIYQAANFEAGVRAVGSNLRDWLDTTSRKGSGDDITLLILARDPCPVGSQYQDVSPG
ncbi:MAG: protein phosphatase 2C domain-containing protein, partial [Methanospirillum sp.]|nr:protein phosphatase 2C domain-containing protein [Methanospirillum sp.]